MDTGENDARAIEDGRLLFAQACDFLISAAELHQVPEAELPEVAFAGRSNVGKSSLINALTRRKTLARTSNTPGRTQQINFFDLGGRLMLADLPGYGFARAPKAAVARWTHLVDSYLKGRAPLKRVCLLIDGRHGIKASDETVMSALDAAAVSYQAVLTKCDKVKDAELERRLAEMTAWLAVRPAAHPRIIATSAKDGRGIPELRAQLAALALT